MRKSNLWYKIVLISAILVISLEGCSGKSNNQGPVENEKIQVTEDILQPTDYPDKNEFDIEETSEADKPVEEINTELVDFSQYFDGLQGGAVFYSFDEDKYYIYNKEDCEKEDSPCSTFKIISTLMGIHENVLKDADTKMGYDGTKYESDSWNEDLGLKEAFKSSCVWYFRKVIDAIGQDKIQKYLDNLNFGNCDISEWQGNNNSVQPELNGFWLESSLKISAIEWVDCLKEIFSGDSEFGSNEIQKLKDIMLTDDLMNLKIYGKTGTGTANQDGYRDKAWFVGTFQYGEKEYCFAVHLTDSQSKEVWGPKAEMIANDIITKYFCKIEMDDSTLSMK